MMQKHDPQEGIKSLLAAEKEAENIIARARADKNALLKSARDEAERTVADFRARREGEFQDYSKKHLGSKDEFANSLAAKTQREIEEMNVGVGTKGNDVVQLLLNTVADVNVDVVETRSGQKVLAT